MGEIGSYNNVEVEKNETINDAHVTVFEDCHTVAITQEPTKSAVEKHSLHSTVLEVGEVSLEGSVLQQILSPLTLHNVTVFHTVRDEDSGVVIVTKPNAEYE